MSNWITAEGNTPETTSTLATEIQRGKALTEVGDASLEVTGSKLSAQQNRAEQNGKPESSS